ncbi:response regulator [Spirosoma flavum]|uniref:Response regulator n=1 Tax=Spirosoma flavum TaxID=2048557 RepID=A0ABW6AIM1_9BACT
MKPQFLVLVVDDDILLTDILNRASRSSFPEATFIQVHSSTEAKKYIEDLDGYGPKLVLLDINLQDKVSGLDFLAFLRAYSQTRFLPVVMLTASQLPQDIETAYTFGASSFTVKPFSYEDWRVYLSNLRLYWFETVTLPAIRFHRASN